LPGGIAHVIGRLPLGRAVRSLALGIPRATGVAMATRFPELLNALDLLTEQHAEIDALFEVLERGAGDRQAAFVELADKLAAHATIEEKLC